MKRKKRMIIILIFMIVMILASVICWGLYRSYWSINNFGMIVSSGNFECFISGHVFNAPSCQHGPICKYCGIEHGEKIDHIYREATCTVAQECTMCGNQFGTALGHLWNNATCTTPKKCSRCGESEGEALGHNTRLGKCTNCGEYIYELVEEFSDIMESVSSAIQLVADGLAYSQKVESTNFGYYCNFTVSQFDFDLAEDDMNNAIKVCGNYEEFSTIKLALQNWKNEIPQECTGETRQELQTYLSALQNFLDASKVFGNIFDGELAKLEYQNWEIFN